MVSRNERVALLATYLAGWRESERAQRAYDAYEIHLSGIDAYASS